MVEGLERLGDRPPSRALSTILSCGERSTRPTAPRRRLGCVACGGGAGLIALVVHEWVGVAFLRRGWVNLDLLWTVAPIATGALLVVL